ncbi:MAG: polysaccharide pyruvyl transferase family protein [Deltaproteobacteria bacterium]|nr:polysaccharide pyruvyl transferase family protein [Deltaproteobacteria bacterium]
MGDEAILQGILEEGMDLNRVDAVSATPAETKRLHGVNAIFRKDIEDEKYSSVILGGGGYPPDAYNTPMTIALRLHSRGAKIIVRAVGPSPELAGKDAFGPDVLGHKEASLLTQVLGRSDYFSVRTNRDLERVRRYTRSTKAIDVENCPAYNITFSKSEGSKLLKLFGLKTGHPLCGVSLAKFGYRKGIRHFIEEYQQGFTLLPIPMCRHYYATFENDIVLLEKYFGEMKILSGRIKKFLRYPFTPSQIKSILSNLSFLITARKHAMIMALGGGLSPNRIIMLGTRSSGLPEHFHVEEVDWRQWPVSPDGLGFFASKRKQDMFCVMNSLLKRRNGYLPGSRLKEIFLRS